MNKFTSFYLKWYMKLNPLLPVLSAKMDSLAYSQRKALMDNNLLHCKDKGVTDYKYSECPIVVSLTTYGKRINSVYLSIVSLMEQTMKANRIILWLDDSFKEKQLPASLMLLCDRGLEIKYCEDLRSYKKLVPALREFPESTIITADDDLIYDCNMLQYLITSYLSYPNDIHCCRAHRMRLDSNGKLLPYNDWNWCVGVAEYSKMLFPTGAGGVLYPPHSLDEEVLNESVFMDICEYADDVWFKAMALKNGTACRKVETFDCKGEEYIEIADVQDMGLSNVNVGNSLNDKQIDAVFKKYNLYKLLSDVN